MNESKRKKLIKFLEDRENKMLSVWCFTLITYAILYFIFRNAFILLFAYFICYLIYSKTYDVILIKLKHSLMKNSNKDIL